MFKYLPLPTKPIHILSAIPHATLISLRFVCFFLRNLEDCCFDAPMYFFLNIKIAFISKMNINIGAYCVIYFHFYVFNVTTINNVSTQVFVKVFKNKVWQS